MAWTKVVTELSANNIAQTAAEAVILETGRTISTTGEVTVTTGAFDGSANVTGAATIANDVVDEANLKISNSASDGMFLQYKDSTDQLTWATPTDISTLANLTDATIDGTPADGEMLVYDSTNKWQNQTLAETGIQPLDADLTALASCQTGAATALALLTSTEVAILDGATATSTELNYLDITTLGTSEASKAVTADASGHVTIANGAYDFDVASHDGTNGLKLGGTLVTASATELNYVKDVTSAIQTQLDAKGVGSITSVTLTTDSGALSAGSDSAGAVPVSILGGTGIVTSNSGMASTVTLSLNELTTSTADGDGDFFAVVDASGADKKLTKANIDLSGFNNDSSWADDQTAAEMATLFAADTGAVQFGGDVTVDGDLIVSGDTVTINTQTLSVEDNVVTLNSNATTGGNTADVDAGIEVERGDQANTSITWDEGKKYWAQHIQKHDDKDDDAADGMIPMVESATTGTSGNAHAVGNFFLNTTTDQLYVNVG